MGLGPGSAFQETPHVLLAEKPQFSSPGSWSVAHSDPKRPMPDRSLVDQCFVALVETLAG
jgi:hypothetical protein